jgi:hypothetical protein
MTGKKPCPAITVRWLNALLHVENIPLYLGPHNSLTQECDKGLLGVIENFVLLYLNPYIDKNQIK